MLEILIFLLVAGLVLLLPLAAFVVGLIALLRSRSIKGLERRVAELEFRLQAGVLASPASAAEPATAERDVAPEVPAEGSEEVAAFVEPELVEPASDESRGPTIQWEMLIGQKAFGWVAVVLAFFAAAFFLKYAYDNNWIGPLGRVAIGAFFGCALMVGGLRYHLRNWPVFSQMLSACGVVVLYLSTYSAFGFYQLVPSYQAGIFLAVIVTLSMIAAVLYDSPAVAFMAVVGGLLTPLLLPNEQDVFVALFIYLAALNLGVGIVLFCRNWLALGTIALVGTQALFWMWYDTSYHPEKFAWAIGFQGTIYGLYLAQDLAVQFRRLKGNRWESALRMISNAAFWFTAVYVLLKYDYDPWMGVAALAMATVYAVSGRLLLRLHATYALELMTSIALSIGFLTLAIPLQADARWISLGWAACAGALWWFGMRVQAAPLRGMAAFIAAMSMVRMLAIDLPSYPRELWWPLLNPVALPSLGVVACLLLSLVLTRRYEHRLDVAQRAVSGLAAMCVLVMLWLVLSIDDYHYFDMLGRTLGDESIDWRRVAQMSLSLLWTLYASVLLAIGFRWRIGGLRWMAIAFYAITVVKVFILDMAGLSELYRIIAFIVLAVVLGVAARVYQRLGRRQDSVLSKETSSDADS